MLTEKSYKHLKHNSIYIKFKNILFRDTSISNKAIRRREKIKETSVSRRAKRIDGRGLQT